jgi:uncharacterized protein YdaU (DUF1376 family)
MFVWNSLCTTMKSPAFRFYAADFITGTDDLSSGEVGVYIRLLCYSWLKGGLPDDDLKLARLSRWEQAGGFPGSVREKFFTGPDGLLYNERLEEERRKQMEHSETQKRNIASRWGRVAVKAEDPDEINHHDGPASPKNNCVVDARLNGIPLSAEEVVIYGATLNPPVSKERCLEFWAYYEGQAKTNQNGSVFWVTKGGAVVTNWKVKLPGFASSGGFGGAGKVKGAGTYTQQQKVVVPPWDSMKGKV